MGNMTLLGKIDFLDLKVPVFYDTDAKFASSYICWRQRNPNVGYKGYLYYNYETGETTYPEGACMPLQTKRDVEIVPQFVISNLSGLTEDMAITIKNHLETDFKLRNSRK